MEWLKSKATTIFGIFCLAVMGLQGYATISMRSTMEARLTAIEDDYAGADEKMTMLSSDLDLVTDRLGITTQELQEAQAAAKQLKQENAQLARRLRSGLAEKADSKAVAKFQNEATTRLNAVQQEATTKIDGNEDRWCDWRSAARTYGPRRDSYRSSGHSIGSQRDS
jgi:chromosome segregation ATPase